ncbi:ribulose phosphate epimerase, partial [Listeria monocytogenes]|nr:ribulose phosphate epimerase [Listeria monocytogenes]
FGKKESYAEIIKKLKQEKMEELR